VWARVEGKTPSQNGPMFELVEFLLPRTHVAWP
jgi:hypothetical protein